MGIVRQELLKLQMRFTCDLCSVGDGDLVCLCLVMCFGCGSAVGALGDKHNLAVESFQVGQVLRGEYKSNIA